jgi:hypothetical protein
MKGWRVQRGKYGEGGSEKECLEVFKMRPTSINVSHADDMVPTAEYLDYGGLCCQP